MGYKYRVPYFTSIDALMDNIEPDIVSILTPSGLHAQHIRQLLPYGKPLIVEKPLTLALADAERPDLLVDLATLTGAARIALGPELPAVFGTRDETLDALLRHGRRVADPLWPLPLWDGYDDEIASKIADINNVSGSTFAGAIIGGLFLRRFVTEARDWLHVDLYGWNPKDRPGRPVGAEPQAVRALYALLVERYG